MSAVKHGIHLAPFGELADPVVLAGIARLAEDHGWDGVFLWDHIRYPPITEEVADPWVALAAIAAATERLAIGPLVTPLSRRRIQKLARETVTLDRLCGRRLVLGVGLGSDRRDELGPYGDETDPVARAALLDDGLAQLAELWAGGFRPVADIPVWVAGRWPNRRPLARAARHDGFFPIDMPGPEVLPELITEIDGLRGGKRPFDIVVTSEPDSDPRPWADAGATWWLADFGPEPTIAHVTAAIEDVRW
jgi:alkanesulfonate monooxygenase SsuD/methylene tetrahydromethanopterin reductase-like flavin-dependent oxidoreductase (luciferase family)